MAKKKAAAKNGNGAGKKPAANGGKSAAQSYKHNEADLPLRPDVGTQAQFKKKKPPRTFKYDSSLSPALDYDGQNHARERGEALLLQILEAKTLEEAHAAARELKALGKPFLNWAGKAERLSFDVPSLPLFIHERLSTKAIIETLAGHKRRKETQAVLFDLFGDPEHSITDQTLKAYEHRDQWTNRMMLGDSLTVMNSLLTYEKLGGQVQMIYIDPPYGVKFGSNFQPFVRKRDVKHGDDGDMTREPEMVQAYRDTWEVGVHSYLTCLRDRLFVARDLLSPSGSVFVQISDENLHHVREVMDEVFGGENACSVISVKKTSGLGSTLLQTTQDFLLWYARDKAQLRFRQLYTDKYAAAADDSHHQRDGDGRLFMPDNLTGQNSGVASCIYEYEFKGAVFCLPPGRQWKTTQKGMRQLERSGRLLKSGKSIRYKRYVDDFPASPVTDTWHDIGGSVQSRSDPKVYVVQTGANVIERCVLLSTDPGDLVLDPTCGSGTTAYVAEQWGRRWITIDTSRVPLALARQRLLTATFPWYRLKDPDRGPAGGFVYERRQNKKGEEVGGIVPHVTLKSIANNEPPQEEVLVDRPEKDDSIVRVTGPFTVEATMPTAEGEEPKAASISAAAVVNEAGAFQERMLEVLRKSPVLRLDGNKTVTFRNVRAPGKSLTLSAEAVVDPSSHGQKANLANLVEEAVEENKGLLKFSGQPVAFVFGPENGPVSTRLVENAAKEAAGKRYTQLYVIGFAIDAKAREAVENCEAVFDIPATYVQATPDLLMGDLLKNLRSSQIFSVCGLPDVKVKKAAEGRVQVELLGLDVFDPVTEVVDSRAANDVPAWFLDTDYNGLCFHVCQAFFPRTSAWEGLKKALKAEFAESVWDHLAGTVSAPFEPGDHKRAAVKVIDDRGNELLVVKELN
jgi:adenine-specific DNA-methyltransferase